MIFSGLDKINLVFVDTVFQFSFAAAIAVITILLLFFHEKFMPIGGKVSEKL